MIYGKDILKDRECPPELQGDLLKLLIKLNKIQDAWGRPMRVTSGYREKADQIRIYNQKGIFDEAQMHMHSKHFTCQAADIFDPQQELQVWILKNLPLVEEIDVWMEDFYSTPNWVHFQIVPPVSGKRFFKP